MMETGNSPLVLKNFRWGWGDTAACVGVVLALALHPVFPLAAWLIPFALLAAWMHVRFYALPMHERIIVVGFCIGSVLLQVATWLTWGYAQAQPDLTWPDERLYFRESRVIAETWREGVFPALSQPGTLPYLGTLHTGYHRIVASVFYLVGPDVRFAILVNVVGVAILPMLVFFLSQSLFDDKKTKFRLLGHPLSVSSAAAALAMLHPTAHYWGLFLLKDLILGSLFIAMCGMAIQCLREPRVWILLAAIAMTAMVLIFRAYAGLALMCGIAGYFVSLLPRKAVIWTALYGLFIIIAVGYSDRGQQYYAQLGASLSDVLTRDTQTVMGTFKYVIRGIPRLLLGPYAWVKAYGEQPYYGLYPGMWYLYLLVIPLTGAGLIAVVRENHRLSIVPIVIITAITFIFLSTYGGEGARQRYFLELLAIPYAGIGVAQRSKRYLMPSWYVILFLFATLQLLTLESRY